jgi:hypothetical protein
MPGYSREQPVYSEEKQREIYHRRLRFIGALAAVSLIGPGLLLWRDGGIWTTVVFAACCLAFWAVPFLAVLSGLRALGKEK